MANATPTSCRRRGRRAAVNEHEPVLLTEAELDHVAAAGSKKGASGAAGCGDPPHPNRPK